MASQGAGVRAREGAGEPREFWTFDRRFVGSVWWLLLTWEFLVPKVLEMDTLRATLRIYHLEWDLGTGCNWVHLQNGVQYGTLTDQVLESSALWEQKRSLEGTQKLCASAFQTKKP